MLEQPAKVVAYLSAEFLTGPHLGNHLINLGIENMPTEEGLPLLRIYNDSVSRMCAEHPDRFRQDTTAAAHEMDHPAGWEDRGLVSGP